VYTTLHQLHKVLVFAGCIRTWKCVCGLGWGDV